MRSLLPAALLAATIPLAAAAEPAIACHCYQDRRYDPSRPAAADPYILATTRSSLLSASFGVDKGTLVRAVMTGSAPDDLFVAHFAGARSGRDAGALLRQRGAGVPWKEALAGAAGLPAPFEALLARGAPGAELAAAAVDDALVGRLGADPASLRALREARASSEEAILATFLSRRLEAPPGRLLASVRDGDRTWGALLAEADLSPERIDEAVRAAVRGREAAAAH